MSPTQNIKVEDLPNEIKDFDNLEDDLPTDWEKGFSIWLKNLSNSKDSNLLDIVGPKLDKMLIKTALEKTNGRKTNNTSQQSVPASSHDNPSVPSKSHQHQNLQSDPTPPGALFYQDPSHAPTTAFCQHLGAGAMPSDSIGNQRIKAACYSALQ